MTPVHAAHNQPEDLGGAGGAACCWDGSCEAGFSAAAPFSCVLQPRSVHTCRTLDTSSLSKQHPLATLNQTRTHFLGGAPPPLCGPPRPPPCDPLPPLLVPRPPLGCEGPRPPWLPLEPARVGPPWDGGAIQGHHPSPLAQRGELTKPAIVSSVVGGCVIGGDLWGGLRGLDQPMYAG